MKASLKSFALILLGYLSASAQSADEKVRLIINSDKFKAAQSFIEKDYDRFMNEIVQLTEIEAPPFKEEKRGKVYLDMLRQHGLSNVEMDAEGNVMGIRKGTGGGPLIAIAAHLDTVFPEGTDVKVKKK